MGTPPRKRTMATIVMISIGVGVLPADAELTTAGSRVFAGVSRAPASVAALPVDPAPGYNATSRPLVEIQEFLDVPATGVWDWSTSDAVDAFQAARHIDRDRIWGRTADGLAFPPEGSLHGVDYSCARPGATTLVDRGVVLAGRYLWRHEFDDGRTNKGISPSELDDLNTAGIGVFFIYEEDGRELLGGFEAGVRVELAAESHRRDLGVGTVPIYFAVDFDVTTEQLAPILAALDGIASVIGRERTGLYGGILPIRAAFDNGKIFWGFQTYAWSQGAWDPRAHLQQWSTNQWNGTIDFTRATTPDYGQGSVASVR